MIYKIHYNWHQASDGESSGEDYHVAEVGGLDSMLKKEVKSIGTGPDDRFYIIIFKNGQTIKVFNPNVVFTK